MQARIGSGFSGNFAEDDIHGEFVAYANIADALSGGYDRIFYV